MNVIVFNVNASKFLNLNVDVIKSITGEFSTEEIIQVFSNFFFNRMFLDITSVEGYRDINTLKKLSSGIDVNKIILLLSNDPIVNSDEYISNLINIGIYNFAHDENEMKYLYDHPNSYKDVAHLQKIQSNTSHIEEDTQYHVSNGVKIIGFKNLTSHAGATSLIYMLKKVLSRDYYVLALELNKRDFMFYRDKDMISCSKGEVNQIISNYSKSNVILVDLNDDDLSICDEVFYLMESSTLKLNKLVMLNPHCFSRLSNKKIILNQSLLSESDVMILEKEANIRFFDVLPCLNDREDNSRVLLPLLEKMDLYKKV